MAKDYRLITAVMRIVMQVLFAYQRKMARRVAHRDTKNLAVAFIQRYGGAINLNSHGHVVMPDAVFVVPNDDDATLQIVELAPPTDDDVEVLVARIARRDGRRYLRWVEGPLDDVLSVVPERHFAAAVAALMQDASRYDLCCQNAYSFNSVSELRTRMPRAPLPLLCLESSQYPKVRRRDNPWPQTMGLRQS